MQIKEPRLINREISWMQFNARVLQEANDPSVPLIDRIKFLGIFSNNLDEFYRVRVATINRMANLKEQERSRLDFNPQKQLRQIMEIDTEQQEIFQQTYIQLIKELKQHNIILLDEKSLNRKQGEFVRQYFQNRIRPLLFPIMLNSSSFTFSLRDQAIYLGVAMTRSGKMIKDLFTVIQVPSDKISRFLILPESAGKKYLILLDDVIRYCLDEIFSIFTYDEIAAYTFKFTRDAELDLDYDISKSFLEVIADSLKKRSTNNPVRFIHDREMPALLLKSLTRKLNVTSRETIYGGGRYHNFKDLMQFPNLGPASLEYPPHVPLPHKDLMHTHSIFSAIREKDIMLHHPYQSFHYIIDLLREASIDPRVKSIRMSLYRLAANSNVINALINAARNGISVTVFMEFQARFDEEANIHYAEQLQSEGVRIIRGIPGLKVHAKIMLIRRKEGNKSVYYGNISTGNYNEQTARVFSDKSLLTSNQEICSEILKIFELVESNFQQPKFRHLVVSPFGMREFFAKLLKKEIKNARQGKPAWAIIKLNNLVDSRMARLLHQAAVEGVNIKLIIRGTCVLKPDAGLTHDQLEIFGVIDRFLEHSRVLAFCNNENPQYFITSADWMNRNFDNRIETAVPIYSPDIKQELQAILDIQLQDNTKARWHPAEPFNPYRKTPSKRRVRSQTSIFRYIQQGLKPEGQV